MKLRIFRRCRTGNAGRSESAAPVSASPATELMKQVARFHSAIN